MKNALENRINNFVDTILLLFQRKHAKINYSKAI